MRTHPLLHIWPGDTCLLHTERCHCRAIERLTEGERNQVQLDWMYEWLEDTLRATATRKEAAAAAAATRVEVAAPISPAAVVAVTYGGRELITISAACARLKMCRRTINVLIKAKKIETLKTPTARYIYVDTLFRS